MEREDNLGVKGFTHLDAQAQQVVHCTAHATRGSSMQRRVSLFVLAVDFCTAGHQQLHHLQVTWGYEGQLLTRVELLTSHCSFLANLGAVQCTAI